MYYQTHTGNSKTALQKSTLNILESLPGIILGGIHMPGGFYSIWEKNKNSMHWTEEKKCSYLP